jgi:hypothetical protein
MSLQKFFVTAGTIGCSESDAPVMLHRMEGSLSPNSFRARRVRLTEDMGHKRKSAWRNMNPDPADKVHGFGVDDYPVG